jgi:hypothetical protein
LFGRLVSAARHRLLFSRARAIFFRKKKKYRGRKWPFFLPVRRVAKKNGLLPRAFFSHQSATQKAKLKLKKRYKCSVFTRAVYKKKKIIRYRKQPTSTKKAVLLHVARRRRKTTIIKKKILLQKLSAAKKPSTKNVFSSRNRGAARQRGGVHRGKRLPATFSRSSVNYPRKRQPVRFTLVKKQAKSGLKRLPAGVERVFLAKHRRFRAVFSKNLLLAHKARLRYNKY